MRWSRLSSAAVAVIVLCGSARSAQRPPVVGIVSQTGKLLPLAFFESGEWQYLPWPEHDDENDSRPPPTVPPGLADIPPDWLEPLAQVPAVWRVSLTNHVAHEARLDVPATWTDAGFTSVGLTIAGFPRTWSGGEDMEAGIAVTGDAAALPVQAFDASSSEWRAIVTRHVAAFQAAERAQAKRVQGGAAVPTQRTLAAQLRHGEVHLAVIEASQALTYMYFDTFLIRPTRPADRALNCDTTASHVGLLVRRTGKPAQIKWLSGGGDSCGALGTGLEVLGAVHAGNRARVVVKWGGDDWVQYALVDPAGPKSRFLAPAMPTR